MAFAYGVTALLLGASGAVLMATGDPVLAALPLILTVAAYLLATLPMRYPLMAFTGVWLVTDMLPRPMSHDGGTMWKSPVYPISNFLGNNLDSVLGVDALRFSGSEAFFFVMLLVAGARWVTGSSIDAAGRRPFPNVLWVVLGASFAAVVLLEVKGMATGGDFRQSLWQFRQILWLPVLTLLFGAGFRGSRDLAPLAVIVTLATVIKIGVGLYYVRRIAIPNLLEVDFMTCHEDSMTFVTTLMLWIAVWAHRPTPRRAIAALVIGLWIFIGIAANERRLAYVSLGGSVALFLLMFRGRMRRPLLRALIYALPLLIPYLAAGRNRSSGIFKPASLIMSVAQQDDESSQTRNIENYNLLQTLKAHPIVGSGWGHEYSEEVKAYDISQAFAQYRYIAHNSVLWLWSIGGVLGFTLIWSPVVMGVFLARRTYAVAQSSAARIGAFTSIAVMASFVNQAWGDMVTPGQTGMVLLGGAMVVAGKLAV
ncbi:MAG: O-antigen ligase family protein [Gemmatimonadaceae bacterium]